ncbi:MAG TPA: hypothetical protein VGI82_07380 [Chitinophagaceae bacterium]
MKIVKVTYAAKEEFSAQNQKNIQTVMSDLHKSQYSGINYNCCLGADGRTFIHTAFFKSEEDHKLLNELPAFIHFQQELKSRGLESPPKQEQLTLVGSSVDMFADVTLMAR